LNNFSAVTVELLNDNPKKNAKISHTAADHAGDDLVVVVVLRRYCNMVVNSVFFSAWA